MRITMFLLLFSVIQVMAENSYSQDTRLSLNLKNVSIENVLDEIENQSEFYFLFNQKLVNVDRKVDINANSKRIKDILADLFTDEDVNCLVIDRQILLSPKNITEAVNVTRERQRQEVVVTGKVTDEDGNPLPGVNIIIKGTITGTITNMDGDYSIEVEDPSAILVFSFIGYNSQEILVNNQTTINVVFEIEAVGLDEVIVIGYGEITKRDLTGAVTQIKAEDIVAYPALAVIQSLQGRTAGVQIQKNNGEPGSSYKVRIRGSTSINSSSDPLYVVDGFPGATMPPPEDIESIQVLKDASATAIYGSRGANGVILVTTKRGKVGKTSIKLNSSYSFQKEISRLDLLGKDDFIDYIEEVKPGALGGTLIGEGTDWQEEVFKPGNTQNYNLSLNGGNESVRYYVSGTLYDQKGIMLNSVFKRYSLTSNIDIKASDRLDFGAYLFLSRIDRNGVHTQEPSGGVSNTGVIASALKFEPTLPVYDEEGNYAISLINIPLDNPVAILNERINESVTDRMQVNLYGNYDILKDLSFRINLGATINNGRTGDYYSTKLLRAMNIGGEGSVSALKNNSLISENYLTYDKTFGNHALTLLGGYSYQSTDNENWSGAAQGFLTDAFLWWDLDGSSTFNRPFSGIIETELSSFYGRVNYKLLNRYLVTVTARYDGSSRFAKNNKWAFFPSGAVAWNIAEESFMENITSVSQLKLRISYGITGNQAIGAYQSLASLSSVHSVVNSTLINAVRPETVANSNLTWESTQQLDVGFDLGLFKQRILLTADYYDSKTVNLLFSYPLPEYTGYESVLKNIGKIRNRGIEFTLSTINIAGEFNWISDFNISLNRNKILELPDGNDIIYRARPGHIQSSESGILREGQQVGAFFGYVYDGVIQEDEDILPGNFEQEAGGERFKDIGTRNEAGEVIYEPDGQLSSADRTIIGNPNPDFVWGVNNTFRYKGFDLNVFFHGTQGNDIYSWTLMELEVMAADDNSTTEALKRWTPTNTNTDVPKASATRSYYNSSRSVFDGSFIRLKNISLGYTLPKSFSESMRIDLLRVSVSAQNILTITDYRGYDPEVNYLSSGNVDSNRNLGYDYGSYPNVKSVTVGLNLTF